MDRSRRGDCLRRDRDAPRILTNRRSPPVQSILDWLVTLSPGTLYAVMSAVALLENLFPPFPSDVVLAFGSFVAAQGTGTAIGVFLATWLGSVSGAMIVYALGRKYGANRVERRMV